MRIIPQVLNVQPKKNNLILHSDQGWHYQHKQYCNILAENSIIQSQHFQSRRYSCVPRGSACYSKMWSVLTLTLFSIYIANNAQRFQGSPGIGVLIIKFSNHSSYCPKLLTALNYVSYFVSYFFDGIYSRISCYFVCK